MLNVRMGLCVSGLRRALCKDKRDVHKIKWKGDRVIMPELHDIETEFVSERFDTMLAFMEKNLAEHMLELTAKLMSSPPN